MHEQITQNDTPCDSWTIELKYNHVQENKKISNEIKRM